VTAVSASRLPTVEIATAFALPLVALVALAANKGGYFPTSWGWVAVPICWAAATAVVVRAPALSRGEAVFVAALAFAALWAGVSSWWSSDVTASVLESERVALYAGAALAVCVVVTHLSARFLVGAVVAATTVIACFGLATRLFPDRVGVFDSTSGYRLAAPIGYWNGLAIFCAIGAVTALGCAAHARTLVARAVAGAAIVVLVTTLYFTYGRAAWIAMGLGVVAAVAIDTGRLRLATTAILVGAPTAVAVAFAGSKPSLTTSGASLRAAAHDGHRVAAVVVAAALLAAILPVVLGAAERRVTVAPRLRRAYALLLAAAALAAVGAGIAAAGGPVTLVHRAHAAFLAPPIQPSDLNRRLFSFSGNGRADLWRVAWHDFRAHPLGGSGSGSYGRYFLAHQPAGVGKVVDAHSLYVETLTEVGPVGLAALAVALAAPLVALRLARRAPLVPAAAGAYVAFLVHAAVDWDWELAVVTTAALLLAGVILVEARPAARLLAPAPARAATIALAAAIAAFSLVGLIGNSALATSDTATSNGDVARGQTYARRAATWMPWSAEPWRALGAAQRSSGDPAAARTSFAHAVSVDSGDWRSWYGLALTSRNATRTHAFRRARSLYPRGGLRLPHAPARDSHA
jgi:hypothetical protein